MPLGTAAALAIGGIGSSLIGSSAANKAAKTQGKAADAATQLQADMYNDTVGRFEPYYEAGTNALDAFLFEMGMGDKPEGYEGYSMSPMASYMLEKGMDSIQGSRAAAGGLYSGETLRQMEEERKRVVGSDMDNYLNRVFGLTSMGSMAAGNMGTAGQNYANNAGNIGMNAAANQGNAYMQGAQQIQTGISDMAGIYGYMNPMMMYAQNTLPMGQAPTTSMRPPARPW